MNSLIFLLCLTVVTARLVYQQNLVYAFGGTSSGNNNNSNNNNNNSNGDDDGDDGDDEDTSIPNTSFSCSDKIDGYYADVETNCAVFHYCQTVKFPGGKNKSVKWSFACPETTIFNQELLTCTPPNDSFNCQDSSSHFDVNQNLTQTTNSSQSSSSTSTTSTTTSTTQSPIPNYYFFHV